MSLVRNQNVLFSLMRERLPAPRPPTSAASSATSDRADGAAPARLLDLPGDQTRIVGALARSGPADISGLAASLGQPERRVRQAVLGLMDRGFVRQERRNGASRLVVAWGSGRRRLVDDETWDAIRTEQPRARPLDWLGRRFMAFARRPRGSFALAAAPIILTFAITEWLLLIDRASYTRPLSVAGVIIVSLLAGMFPVMLLAASRRRGELVPEVSPRLLGHLLVVGGIYLFYLVGLLAHGLVIWNAPVERAGALAAGGLICAVTIVAVWRGAFRPRVVVELRSAANASHGAVLDVVAGGRPLHTICTTIYEDGSRCRIPSGDPLARIESLRWLRVNLLGTRARDLLVWLYRENEDGGTEPLPARVAIRTVAERRDLELSGERATSRLDGPCQVEIALDAPGRP
jgi:hypothetical protein